MPARPLLLALNPDEREVYVGRAQSSGKKPRALSHWSDAAWSAAYPIEGVPQRYTKVFLGSFAKACAKWGYRMILGKIS